MPNKIVISDTSCLIAIEKTVGLELLRQLYTEITIPDQVAEEYGKPLPEWIRQTTIASQTTFRLFEESLGTGEAAAISLALEYKDCRVLIDDLKARKVATMLGIPITGVLGVLLRAKNRGIIKEIRPLIEKLREIGFYFSQHIEQKILDMAGE